MIVMYLKFTFSRDADEYVLRLEVAMHNPSIVDVLQPINNLLHDGFDVIHLGLIAHRIHVVVGEVQ